MKIVSHNVSYNASSVIEVNDYEAHIPTITLTLQDYYGQDVVTESLGYAQLLVPNNSPQNCQTDHFYGYIGGGIVEQFENGVATFKEVDAFCAPDGVMYLDGTSDLVLNTTVIELNFRSCVVGGEHRAVCLSVCRSLCLSVPLPLCLMCLWIENNLCWTCADVVYFFARVCVPVRVRVGVLWRPCRVLRGTHLRSLCKRDLLLHRSGSSESDG